MMAFIHDTYLKETFAKTENRDTCASGLSQKVEDRAKKEKEWTISTKSGGTRDILRHT